MSLSLPEITLIFGLVFLMGLECFKAVQSGSWVQVYRPTLFIAVFLSFYALVGPLRALLAEGEVANFVGTSGTIYRDIDHRAFLVWGWLGAFLFYGFLLLGFYIQSPLLRPVRTTSRLSLDKVRLSGFLLCWLGFCSYLLVKSESFLLVALGPLFSMESIPVLSWLSHSFLSNYLLLSANLLIPGVVLQYCVWLRQRTRLYVVIAWFFIASSVFLIDGFRYRILLLVFPIILLWLFYAKKKPRLILFILFMVAFVGLNGAYSVARHIGKQNLQGPQYEALARYNPLELLNSSFEEAGVFFTTSAAISKVPAEYPYVGLAPISTALQQPIPRSIYPDKPQGEYSVRLRELIYGKPDSYTAYLGFAEYYLMAGWPSLVLISFCLGWGLRRLWTWFLWRQYEPLAQSIYLLNACFLYVLISRGYFPQVVMLYCFTLLPAIFIYWLVSRKVVHP